MCAVSEGQRVGGAGITTDRTDRIQGYSSRQERTSERHPRPCTRRRQRRMVEEAVLQI